MNVNANKHLLLWSSLATIALLGTAAYRENVAQEWRQLQKRYREQLPAGEASGFPVQLRQIVAPSLDATDRCVTCHVGMAVGTTAVSGDAVFGAHPPVVHDPSEFGCTVCHAGQGRATEKAPAHGDVQHWPQPMLPKRFAAAGCGVCHTHLAVPNDATLQHGMAVLERADCLACHRLDGRGGTLRPGGAGGMEGPDLSRVGAVGFDPSWYESHLQRSRTEEGAWKQSFGPLAAADRVLLEDVLHSRVGAPHLIRAKATFHSLGCRGCHSIGGVGGDDGPALDAAGDRDPGQLDFSHVPTPHTLVHWLEEHFRAPSRVVPGSQMPEFGLSDAQIEELVCYMLSLRRETFPQALWPNDRIASLRLGQREFATDGATLYGTFCAACHGLSGQGMRYPGMPAFPAIANPDFLLLASNDFIEATIRRGRIGRRMPAWEESSGGLRSEEITTLVSWLRQFAGGVQPESDARPRRWVDADVETGSRLYARHCAACHGDTGGGGEGTALRDPVLQQYASDSYFVETVRRGRTGTSMPAFGRASVARSMLSNPEIESIVAFIRTWEAQP